MAIPFHLVQSETASSLTAKINDDIYTAEDTHPNWAQLVAAVTTADDDTDLDTLIGLFDPAVAVQTFFDKVSERVSVAGGHVYFDGEEVNDGLANHIIQFINEGHDAGPYINFLENIQTNPNEHSRTQLFDWLSKREFTITPEGHFLAYKGVRHRQVDADDRTASYAYESISTGRAIVDGKVFTGAIPNGVGAVVEMPRGSVAHDPEVACHTGLHAGNWRYASSFAQGAVLTVEINPRDVVSVPHDSDSEKIRCCRYVVREVTEQEHSSSFYSGFAESETDLDPDYSDEDDYEDDEQEEDEESTGYPVGVPVSAW